MLFGKLIVGYIIGSATAATCATILDIHSDDSELKNEYEERHRDKYAKSVQEWKYDLITNKFMYYFSRTASYPIVVTTRVILDKGVDKRLKVKRELEEQNKYYL